MQVGINLRQFVETVQLLQDLVVLQRAHPEYHEDTLAARAQVLATRRLLPKPTEDKQ